MFAHDRKGLSHAAFLRAHAARKDADLSRADSCLVRRRFRKTERRLNPKIDAIAEGSVRSAATACCRRGDRVGIVVVCGYFVRVNPLHAVNRLRFKRRNFMDGFSDLVDSSDSGLGRKLCQFGNDVLSAINQ